MKFCHVDKEGNFELRGDIRVLYSVMMFIRVMLIRTAGWSFQAALTIAIRYAAVRRQFSTLENSKKERRLLDYQTHHFKLIPNLALSYAQRFASTEVENLYDKLMEDIKTENFESLELLHHYASGFKAYFCDVTHKNLEVVRQACGGVGFADNAGFTAIMSDYYPSVTFEGDTTIMTQQAARYLMKAYKAVGRGSSTSFPLTYLNGIKKFKTAKSSATKFQDYLKPEVIEDALAVRAGLMISITMLQMEKQKNVSKQVLQNEKFAQEIQLMTRFHFHYLTFIFFKKHIAEAGFKDQKIVENLTDMLVVYGLSVLTENTTSLFESGYFSQGHL